MWPMVDRKEIGLAWIGNWLSSKVAGTERDAWRQIGLRGQLARQALDSALPPCYIWFCHAFFYQKLDLLVGIWIHTAAWNQTV